MAEKNLILYFDEGILGTFIGLVPHPSEDNYVFVEYVPFNTFPAKVRRMDKAIKRDDIHNVVPFFDAKKGVPHRWTYIHTGGEGSIASEVFATDDRKKIEELEGKNRSLEIRNASLVQELETAQSGVAKNISKARNIAKTSSQNTGFGGNVFDRMRRRDDNSFGGTDDYSGDF